MKKYLISGALAAAVAIISLVSWNMQKGETFWNFNVTSTKTSDDEKLGNFTLLMMDIVNADLSSLRRQILARTLVRVTGEIFTEYRHREAFVGIVAQESRFSASAKSPVGATGISQIMPQYANDFAKLCGLSDFKSADLMDVELNLYLGACFYRDLLEKLGGNITSAQVAYNGGLAGAGIKALLAQQNITNQENSNYPTQISYKKEEAKLALEKVEGLQPKVETLQGSPADLTIIDPKFTAPNNSQLRVKFSLQNSDNKSVAVGVVAIVASFQTKEGVQLFITNPPLLEANKPKFNYSFDELRKKAIPFSIKKVKEYELDLTSPAGVDGVFKEIKVVAFDSRNNGIVTTSISVHKQ